MRFIVILLAALLVSCATPKTAPKSFYSGVYAPGAVQIEEDGKFHSKATVWDEGDAAIARKSAYARLMLEAKAAGYRSFTITGEKRNTIIGHGFSVRGKLFKSVRTGANNFPIDAIKRLLKDLPLEAPKPVYKPQPRKVAKKPRSKSARPAAKSPQAKQTQATEEPLVIMAPEDITGSIRSAGSTAPSGPTSKAAEVRSIQATSAIPTGVVLRRQ